MTLKEQVFAQAAALAGELDGQQGELLNALSAAAVASLSARLREGITPEDCREDFVAAASLFALAALNEAAGLGGIAEFKAGDLTVKRSGADAASRCLHSQARMLMAPYLKDSFAFVGV